jgi:ATP-binding cassette subfamily C protein CydD
VVAFALVGTLATVAFAWQLSLLVVAPEAANLWLGLSAAAVKALTLIGQEWFSAIAAAKVKQQLRGSLLKRVGDNKAWLDRQSSVELNLLLTTGLDSLDAYFAKFLPQVVYTALATPIFVFFIFTQDWLSAVTILITLPLIPLFMIFIGWATSKVQSRQLNALTALSQHFVDALRGLTTLRVFSRAKVQLEIMRQNSEAHRSRTMKVLSITFLSGFALELIASLAVALVAVSIGLRLIDGSITLAAGLLVLILAPDAYLPLRMVGANFHASADGVAAIDKTLTLLDQNAVDRPTVATLVAPKPAQLTVLVGPSGIGKSTTLKALRDEDCAWMPQRSVLFDDTVRGNIVGASRLDEPCFTRATQMAALDDLDFDLQLGSSFSTVSGGQQQRIALARVFYRALLLDSKLLLLDEPTAALDEDRAELVLRSIETLAAEGRAVVAVSHQTALIASADEVIEVSA